MSLDFRKRVFSVKEERGLTFKDTSKLFGIDIRTLFRWQERLSGDKQTGYPIIYIDESGFALDAPELMTMLQKVSAVAVYAIGTPEAESTLLGQSLILSFLA